MPLTAKGEEIKHSMEKTYGSEKKAEQVLYASKNAGTITGIDSDPNRIMQDHIAGGIAEDAARELAFGEYGSKPAREDDGLLSSLGRVAMEEMVARPAVRKILGG